jgi:hypothetical protein
MEAPTFKSFERASMIPENMNPIRNNIIPGTNLTLEENNVYPLVINRTKNNFDKHVYVIFSDNQELINNCLTYIRNLTKLTIKEDIIDMLEEFKLKDYSEEYIYSYDFRKNDIKNVDIAGKEHLNSMLQHIIDKTQGVIIVSDSYENIPRLLMTRSVLIFIDKDTKNVNKIIKESSNILITDNIDLKNTICINKTSLWSKLTLF